jgi:DNA mismatch repair protein MutL
MIVTLRSFDLFFQEITFRLRHGDRTIFELARSSREDRIRQLWGDSFANGLCRIEAEEDGRRLEWFVVRPGHSLSPVAAEMLFFVNGRQIYSKELKEWLLESCGAHFSNCRALPSILFLDLPPEQVDVNVHPTKREVRFSDRAALRKFLMGKIERGLWEQNRSICWALPPRQNCGWDREMECPEAQKAPCVPKLDPKSEQRPPSFSANMDVEPLPKAFSGPDRRVEPPAEVQSKTLGWRYIGLLNRDCALFDSGTGLVFFEMKKAALHVARQRLLSTLDCPARQRLLTPIELNLSGWSEEGKNARLCALGRFGFTVETDPAGRHRATEVPCWLDGAHAETFLRTYLSTDPPPDFAEAISQFLAPAETVRDERYAAQLLEAVATSARPHLSAACHEIPYAEIRRRILES